MVAPVTGHWECVDLSVPLEYRESVAESFHLAGKNKAVDPSKASPAAVLDPLLLDGSRLPLLDNLRQRGLLNLMSAKCLYSLRILTQGLLVLSQHKAWCLIMLVATTFHLHN